MERDYKQEQKDREEWVAKLKSDGWEKRHIEQAEAGWEYIFDMWEGGIGQNFELESAAMDMAEGYMAHRGNKKKGDSQGGVADNIFDGMQTAKRYKRQGTWKTVA